MNHIDHVNLLRPAGLPPGATWADLGAGSGAFTLALRELLGPEAEIIAIDRNRSSLNELQRAYGRRFGDTARLRLMEADFTKALELPPLDGVLMANSLHFHKEKAPILKRVRELLKPGGVLLIVEYNVDKGNAWVPYPFAYNTFEVLAAEGGFTRARLLGTHPSGFLREFYAAAAKAA